MTSSIHIQGPGPEPDGSGFRIGDGYVLTAAHVVFEWNRRAITTAAQATIADLTFAPGSVSNIEDYRNWVNAFLTYINNTYTNVPISSVPANKIIESHASIIQNDTIIIQRSGGAGGGDDGMVVFLDPQDMLSSGNVLPNSRVRRKAEVSGTQTGTIDALNPSFTTGSTSGTLEFSRDSQGGDSGGAILLGFDSRDFIIGTNFGSGGGKGIASRFSYAEWSHINSFLENGQSGNVTDNDPTNLIVGTDGVQNATNARGSYRADIILGRGGNDTLHDGDVNGDSVWANDRLFGGAGVDTFQARGGSDLIHGGDHRAYSGGSRISLEADGDETIDYKNLDINEGLTITFGLGNGGENAYRDSYREHRNHTTDFDRAVFVQDMRTGKREDIDALVSIETIKGTDKRDIFRFSTLDIRRLAADGTSTTLGGLKELDLGANEADPAAYQASNDKGDFIDFAESTQNIRYNFSTNKLELIDNNGTFVIVKGVEAVRAGEGNDELIGGANNDTLIGGEGLDTLIGNGGADTYRTQIGNEITVDAADNEFFIGDTLITDVYKHYVRIDGEEVFDHGTGNDAFRVYGAVSLRGNGNTKAKYQVRHYYNRGELHLINAGTSNSRLRNLNIDTDRDNRIVITNFDQSARNVGITLNTQSFEDYIENDLATGDGSTNCFIAGTRILLADGKEKPIEDIEVGDVVFAFDENEKSGAGELYPRKVARLFRNAAEEVIEINDMITTTRGHRFLRADGRFVLVEELEEGDMLVDQYGQPFSIEKLLTITETTAVYNFEVEDLHTYVANGIRVHNDSVYVYYDQFGRTEVRVNSDGTIVFYTVGHDGRATYRVELSTGEVIERVGNLDFSSLDPQQAEDARLILEKLRSGETLTPAEIATLNQALAAVEYQDLVYNTGFQDNEIISRIEGEGDVGREFGSQLASFVNLDNPFAEVIVDSLIIVAVENLFEVIEAGGIRADLPLGGEGAYNVLANLPQELVNTIIDEGQGLVSSYLSKRLVIALSLEGFAGQIVGQLSESVINELIDFAQAYLDYALNPNRDPDTPFDADGQAQTLATNIRSQAETIITNAIVAQIGGGNSSEALSFAQAVAEPIVNAAVDWLLDIIRDDQDNTSVAGAIQGVADDLVENLSRESITNRFRTIAQETISNAASNVIVDGLGFNGQSFGDQFGRALTEQIVDNIVDGVFDSTLVVDGKLDFGRLFANVPEIGSKLIVSAFVSKLGIDGEAGELLTTFGTELLTTIGNNIITEGFSAAFDGLSFGDIGINLLNIAGSYLRNKLFDSLVKNEAGAIGGQIGSLIGSIVDYFTFKIPIFQTIGRIIGTLIGNLFGTTPRAGSELGYNEVTGEFEIVSTYKKGKGNLEATKQIANQVADTINGALDAVGGTLLNAHEITPGHYGIRKGKLHYKERGNGAREGFDDIGDLINFGVFNALEEVKIAGGDTFVKRALYLSLDQQKNLSGPRVAGTSSAFAKTGNDFEVLLGNLIAAADYSRYAQNTGVINALITLESGSAFAAGYLITFQKAQELGLYRRHEADWLGGWNFYTEDRSISDLSSVTFRIDAQTGGREIVFVNEAGEIIVEEDTIASAAKDEVVGTGGSNNIRVTGASLAAGYSVNGQVRNSAYDIDVAAAIRGGGGNDTIRGGDRGNDIYGDGGHDTLYGGATADWLFGGAGNDTLYAVDNLTGRGNDDGNYLDGGSGADRIYGGAGSDWLVGGDGNDRLNGGHGGDILAGGRGSDSLYGGAGDDTFIYRRGDGATRITDSSFVDSSGTTTTSITIAGWDGIFYTNDLYNQIAQYVAGGFGGGFGLYGNVRNYGFIETNSRGNAHSIGGEDTLVFGAGIGLADLRIRESSNDLVIEVVGAGAVAGDVVTLDGWFNQTNRIEWLEFTSGQRINIGSFSTFTVGTIGGDVIIGTQGRDFIHGDDGNDVILALAGADVGIGGLGFDLVAGDAGDDLVLGGDQADQVLGGSGDDIVSGDSGNDVLVGGAGRDILTGGEGNDTVIGGAGNDTFKFSRGQGHDTIIDAYSDSSWQDISDIDTDGSDRTFRVENAVDSDGNDIQRIVYYDADNVRTVVFDGHNWVDGAYRFREETTINTNFTYFYWGGYDFGYQYWDPQANSGETVYTLQRQVGTSLLDSGNDTLEFDIGITLQDVALRRQGNDLEVILFNTDQDNVSLASRTDRLTVRGMLNGSRLIENFSFFNTGVLNVAALGTINGGGDGDDSISGGSGHDWLTGAAGDDTLTGNAGNDLLVGHGGADRLRAGAGQDTLIGGSGDDLLLVDNDGDADVLAGGDGFDTVSYEDATAGVTARLYDARAELLPPSASADHFVEIEGITGSAHTDFLTANEEENEIRGGAGDDYLYGLGGDDTYIIGSGDGVDQILDQAEDHSNRSLDYLFNSSGYVTGGYTMNLQLMSAEPFPDGSRLYEYRVTIDNPSGQNIYTDWIFTNNEIHEAHASIVDFSRLGGYFGTGNGWERARIIGSIILSDGGEDSIILEDADSLSTLAFTREGNDLRITSGADGALITGHYDSNLYRRIEELTLADGLELNLSGLRINQGGTSADNIIVGTTGNNSYNGGGGNDIMIGGAGNDTLSGGSGDDIIDGGAGADRINGNSHGSGPAAQGDTVRYVGSSAVTVDLNNTSTGQSGGYAQGDILTGIENVQGSHFADTITGNGAANILSGYSGNDTLRGGDGDDVILGGDNNDSLYGDAGNDIIHGNDNNDRLYGDAGQDTLSGGAGVDTLYGQNDDDVITGGTERDYLRGGNGNDALLGEEGNDDLDGNNGNDTLDGGLGDDHLQGGGNDDVYIYRAGTGTDTIDDSSGSRNQLVLQDIATADVEFVRSGNNLNIRTTDGSSNIILSNYFAAGTRIHRVSTATDGLFLSTATPINSLAANGVIRFADLDGYWHEGEGAAPTADGISLVTGTGFAVSGAVIATDHDEDISYYELSTAPSFGTVDVDAATGAFTYTPGDTYTGIDTFYITVVDDLGHEVRVQIDVDVRSTIFGTAGNDTLDGTSDHDAISAGGGNDLIRGSAGRDTLDGGAGFDTVNYAVSQNAILIDLQNLAANTGDAAGDEYTSIERFGGSNRNDTLYGSSANEALDGFIGNDYVNGRGGNDTLYGYAGNDTLYGGSGNDALHAQSGTNNLYGQDGDDLLYSGSGTDRLDGGTGFDRVLYHSATGAVRIEIANASANTGWAANDIYIGVERIDGSQYNDVLLGGNDTIHLAGYNGNDRIESEGGTDYLYGQNGNDTLRGGAGNDYLYGGAGADLHDGESGSDDVRYDDATSGVTVDLANLSLNTGFAAGDTYISIERIVGSNHGDTLNGSSAANRLHGISGNDTIDGRGGNDTLWGGNGNDTIRGGAGTDYIYGENNNDFLYGGDDRDYIYAQSGTDRLYGEGGDDYLYSGNGADRLDGGDGFDYALYYESSVGITLDLINTGQSTGYAAGDTFFNIERIYASYHNDTLRGSNSADQLHGHNGNDLVEGRDGDDRIWGGNGDDTLYGGNGVDRIYGNNGNDTIRGGADRDYIYAYAGSDSLYGEDGNDLLYSGDGGDRLDGGSGSDYVYYTQSTAGITLDLNNASQNTGFASGDTFISIERYYGSYHDDSLRGSSAANQLHGHRGNDYVDGRGGNDYLWGHDDNDTLIGGSGADTLDGGLGADRLVSGTGNDILYGRQGNDVYVIGRNSGSDTIYQNSSDGTGDLLSFVDTITHKDLFFQQSGNHLLIHVFGESTVVTVRDWFTNTNNRLSIELQNGGHVTAAEVEAIVSIMSAYSRPTTQAALDAMWNQIRIEVSAYWGVPAENTAPTDIIFAGTISEGAGNGALVGDASHSDPEGDGATYELTNTAGGRFTIDSATGQVRVANASAINYENAVSHGITIRVTDTGGLTYSESFTVNVTNVNEAPTLTTVNPTTHTTEPSTNVIHMPEDKARRDWDVAYLGGSDPEGQSLTYFFKNGSSYSTVSADGRFKIVGTRIEVNQAVLDYENTPNSLSYTIAARDTGGLYSAGVGITIRITNVNEAPTDIALGGSRSASEAAGNGTVVADASHTDPEGGTVTYSLTNNAGGRFAINSSNGVVTIANAGAINYESATSHTISIRVTDSGGLHRTENFTINVTNVNEAPTDIALGGARSVSETAGNGTVVADASHSDPEGGTITYSLTNNAGGRFAINSSTGVVTVANAGAINYEAATSHTIGIRVTDSGGLHRTENFTITVNDVNEAPVVTTQGATRETGGYLYFGRTVSGIDPEGTAVSINVVNGVWVQGIITLNSMNGTAIVDVRDATGMTTRVTFNAGRERVSGGDGQPWYNRTTVVAPVARGDEETSAETQGADAPAIPVVTKGNTGRNTEIDAVADISSSTADAEMAASPALPARRTAFVLETERTPGNTGYFRPLMASLSLDDDGGVAFTQEQLTALMTALQSNALEGQENADAAATEPAGTAANDPFADIALQRLVQAMGEFGEGREFGGAGLLRLEPQDLGPLSLNPGA